MKSDIHTTKEILINAGLKATHPRIMVFHELVNSDLHPTADQLYDRIKENNPSIARGTVYRILDHLIEAGLVNQVSSRQNLKRYDANLNDHNHIYCMKTNHIQDFYDEELNVLIKKFFEEKKIENFDIKEIKVQINGERKDPDKKVNIV